MTDDVAHGVGGRAKEAGGGGYRDDAPECGGGGCMDRFCLSKFSPHPIPNHVVIQRCVCWGGGACASTRL